MSASAILLVRDGVERESGVQNSGRYTYLVTGAADELTAEITTLGVAPRYIVMANGNALPLNDLQLKVAGCDPSGNLYYHVTAGYGTQTDKQQTVIQFDTDGGTQKITQSIETVNSYAAGGATPPDFQGAINVGKDNVEGVEITVPTFKWTEKRYLPNSLVNPSYIVGLANLTGKTNNASFRTFPEGQVLFLGASGSRTGTDIWEVTFKFAASPDVNNITIGNISNISKGGWEYLWVAYEDDVNSNNPVKIPKAVYVERVYDEGDFSTLGIGAGAT